MIWALKVTFFYHNGIPVDNTDSYPDYRWLFWEIQNQLSYHLKIVPKVNYDINVHGSVLIPSNNAISEHENSDLLDSEASL